MADMQGLMVGVVGFITAVVAVVIGVVLTSKLGGITGLGADAVAAAQNGTSLLSSILVDWGSVAVLSLIIGVLLVPLLFFLMRVAREGSNSR